MEEGDTEPRPGIIDGLGRRSCQVCYKISQLELVRFCEGNTTHLVNFIV